MLLRMDGGGDFSRSRDLEDDLISEEDDEDEVGCRGVLMARPARDTDDSEEGVEATQAAAAAGCDADEEGANEDIGDCGAAVNARDFDFDLE